MSQSLSSILIHLVFSTKHRKPLITPTLEKELLPIMVTTMKNIECPVLSINGTDDHVHLLFSLSRTRSLSDVVKELKGSSSRWINGRSAAEKSFQWQAGYGAFSIGRSQVEQVKRYITRQKEHHKRLSFQDELRALLRKYEVSYDEKYVWD